MGATDYFVPVAAMDSERLRAFLSVHAPDEYNLVDVRQPAEYEEGHIPGSRLIPLAELPDRLDELDPEKTTIAY
jgi:sulfur-carrier protein adenylyltransferase/sulfurtransferase